MTTCAKCGKELPIFARDHCKACYHRAYRRTRLYSAKDDAGKHRIQARKHFISAMIEMTRGIVSRCEVSDAPAVWAANNLRLPDSKSYGQNGHIDWSISPDSMEVLEYLRNPAVHKISLAYSAQTGKSLLLQAALGYLSVVRGQSSVYGLPSVALQRSVPTERIIPLLELSKIKHTQKHGTIHFEGQNTLSFVLLTSRNQCAERSAAVVICDEIDELGEQNFDPVADLNERQRIYSQDITILASTPRLPDKHILTHLKSSRQHVIEWSCPHCNEWFECNLEDIRCKEPEVTDPEAIMERHLGYIACPHCGCVIDDSQHLQLVKSQRWKCTTPERGMRNLGFRKWIIQTAFKNFSDVLAKKLESEGNPTLWAQFLSNWAAQPIDAGIAQNEVDNPITRGPYKRGEPPADSIGWTFGADVGASEIWVSCLAWSTHGIRQFYSERINRDRNDQAGVLRGFMHLIHDRPWSKSLPLLGGCVDVGYEQDAVLKMIAKLPLCVGAKGNGSTSMALPNKPSSCGRFHIVNQPYYQDLFQSYLNSGTLQIPIDAYAWVETHFRGEVKKTVVDPKTRIPRQIWALRGPHSPNHLRDASILALFIGQQKGLCNIKVKPSATQAVSPQPQQPPMTNGFKRIPIRGVGKRERW